MDPARSRSLLALAPLLVLPLAAATSGCSKKACFEWDELLGECPPQDEAITFFQNPDCDSSIQSIDSAPEWDGQFCCYDVSTVDLGDEYECVAPPSGGSSGGGGVGGASPVPPPEPLPPSPACFGCGDVVFNFAPGPPCPGSDVLVKEFFECACSANCADACGDNLCVDTTTTSNLCFECLNDGSGAGCSVPFNNCLNDFGQF